MTNAFSSSRALLSALALLLLGGCNVYGNPGAGECESYFDCMSGGGTVRPPQGNTEEEQEQGDVLLSCRSGGDSCTELVEGSTQAFRNECERGGGSISSSPCPNLGGPVCGRANVLLSSGTEVVANVHWDEASCGDGPFVGGLCEDWGGTLSTSRCDSTPPPPEDAFRSCGNQDYCMELLSESSPMMQEHFQLECQHMGLPLSSSPCPNLEGPICMGAVRPTSSGVDMHVAIHWPAPLCFEEPLYEACSVEGGELFLNRCN